MHSLSKETTRAIQILTSSLKEWDGTLCKNLELGETSTETDYKAFSYQKIILVKGENWRWNRTSHVSNIALEPGVFVSVSKMNSRSKIARGESPAYKVWLYTIVTNNGSSPLYFVWCERGCDPIVIEDYAFLRPFVSDSLAAELNWY